MANDASEILVGGRGSVHVAPKGTALPADIDAALDAAFVELGYTSDEGVTFTDGKTTEDVRVWQSFHPARKIVTERSSVAGFQLVQWNEDTIQLAFGGGTVTATANGKKYEPPAPETLDERAMVIEVLDGNKKVRIVVENGLVVGDVEANFTRTSEANLPISFEALATADEGDETAPWYLLGNDAFWQEAS